MITIAEAISDLLFLRDTVVVPGLGAFVKKPVSAKVNPVVGCFTMPSSVIEFDAALREDNVLLVSYLSEKNEIPEDEARKLLAMFVSDCFNILKNKKKVVLGGLGALSYDWADDLVFEQDTSINYNSDAFGLSDFTLEPVMRSKTKEEIKAEIEQQQKDKNTPVTVDEKAVHEQDSKEEIDDDELRHFGWLWVILGLLLVAGVLFGLQYLKVVDFKRWFERTEKQEQREPWVISFPREVKPWPVVEVVAPEKIDTIAPEVDDTIVPEEVETSEANIRIIAGCFGQEDNAVRLVSLLKEKGYTEAFYELRGSKWYVSFGRYSTNEEAKTALREIRENTEYKAWILK